MVKYPISTIYIYTISYYISHHIRDYIISDYTISYYTISYYTISYHIIFFYFILYYNILYYIIIYYHEIINQAHTSSTRPIWSLLQFHQVTGRASCGHHGAASRWAVRSSENQWSNEGDEKICDGDDDDDDDDDDDVYMYIYISKTESCQSRRTTTESEISQEPLLSTSGYRNVGGQVGTQGT